MRTGSTNIATVAGPDSQRDINVRVFSQMASASAPVMTDKPPPYTEATGVVNTPAGTVPGYGATGYGAQEPPAGAIKTQPGTYPGIVTNRVRSAREGDVFSLVYQTVLARGWGGGPSLPNPIKVASLSQ